MSDEVAFCGFCGCQSCLKGYPREEHAPTADGRWICGTCWTYDVCTSTRPGDEPNRNGPCEEPECKHRPKLTGPWEKFEEYQARQPDPWGKSRYGDVTVDLCPEALQVWHDTPKEFRQARLAEFEESILRAAIQTAFEKEPAMSLDFSLCELQPVEVFSENCTHNLGPMAKAAGLYQVLWAPDEIGLEKARSAIPILRAGIRSLEDGEAHFQSLSPPNGWGDHRGFLKFVRSVLAACEEYPDAKIRIRK